MLLIVLFVFLFILGAFCIRIGNTDWYEKKGNEPKEKKKKLYYFLYKNDDTFLIIGWVVVVLMLIVFLVCGGIILDANIDKEATVYQLEEQYKALVFKGENDFARDEFGLLNKDIVDEIEYWNTTISYKKKIQNNSWIGIFIPDIYDQFEVIDWAILNK